MQSASGKHVLVSYSHNDKKLAEELVRLLEAQGVNVWWDVHLVNGDESRPEIEERLVAAHKVIVLWTRNSIASRFVRSEASRAAGARPASEIQALVERT